MCMTIRRGSSACLFSGLLLLAILLTGCGSGSNRQGSAASTPTPLSGCPGHTTTTGTVQRTASSSFTLVTPDQQSVQVRYASTTLTTRESLISTMGLQQGTVVKVAVTSQQRQSYTALTIVVLGSFPASSASPGGAGGSPGNAGCVLAPGDPTAGYQTLGGPVVSVSRSQLQVLDGSKPNQPALKIALTSATKCIRIDAVSPESLQAGMHVTVISSPSKHGSLSASFLAILL